MGYQYTQRVKKLREKQKKLKTEQQDKLVPVKKKRGRPKKILDGSQQ